MIAKKIDNPSDLLLTSILVYKIVFSIKLQTILFSSRINYVETHRTLQMLSLWKQVSSKHTALTFLKLNDKKNIEHKTQTYPAMPHSFNLNSHSLRPHPPCSSTTRHDAQLQRTFCGCQISCILSASFLKKHISSKSLNRPHRMKRNWLRKQRTV